jgi:hypothetical protein
MVQISWWWCSGHALANTKQGRRLGTETPKPSHYGLVQGLPCQMAMVGGGGWWWNLCADLDTMLCELRRGATSTWWQRSVEILVQPLYKGSSERLEDTEAGKESSAGDGRSSLPSSNHLDAGYSITKIICNI